MLRRSKAAGMPCYLFTYHAYRSWMPDRPRGYVRRGQGIRPADESMAQKYRRSAKHDAVVFHEHVQRSLIGAALEACEHQGYRAHFIATDPTHVHLLVSWETDRSWHRVRSKLKESMTRCLNQSFNSRDPTGRRRTNERSAARSADRRPAASHGPWFSRGASRKRLRDRQHFEYLVREYLPSHAGLAWHEGVGVSP